MNTNPFTAKMWSHRFPAFCLGELVLMKPSCCWTVLYRYVCVCACCCIFIYILDLHNRLVTWNTLKYIKIHEPITILAMGTWGILGVILRYPVIIPKYIIAQNTNSTQPLGLPSDDVIIIALVFHVTVIGFLRVLRNLRRRVAEDGILSMDRFKESKQTGNHGLYSQRQMGLRFDFPSNSGTLKWSS